MPTTYDLLTAATALLAASWDMDLDAFDAALTAWIGDADDKAARIAAVHRAMTHRVTMHRAEEDAHHAARKRAEQGQARMAAMMGQLLRARRELGEAPKIPGVASLVGNGGVRPLVQSAPDVPPADMPAQWVRVTREYRRMEIGAALEAGETVPGFTLGERGERVRWD